MRTLHAGAGGLGALTALWGAGAVAGSAVYARFRAVSPHVLITVGAGALAAGFVIMAAAPNLVAALTGAAVAGLGDGVFPRARCFRSRSMRRGWR